MTDRFTIAHLTDAHLPTHGGFAPRELIGKRFLSALNWALHRRRRHSRAVADALRDDVIRAAPDHVAMTGDVVNFGLRREFAAGADWLAGFGPADRLSFTPGNHESLQAGADADMRAAFTPWSTADEWPWVRRMGPVTLIGVSTSVPTPPGYAQGEVGAAQLARLESLLAAARGTFRMILIHHPPTDMTKPSKALRDAAAFRAVIARTGAEMILHGHDHRNELSWIDRDDGLRVPVLGAPSASQPKGHGQAAEWRLLAVEDAAPGWRVTLRRRAIGVDLRFYERGAFAFRIG